MGRQAGAPLWLWGGVGLGALGLALAASRDAREAAATAAASAEAAVEEGVSWLKNVIDRVSSHEGRYDSLNLNRDGAGLSFGILQWAQRPGTLGMLLDAMCREDSHLFAQVFGPDWQALLTATRAAALGPVGGAVLWQEPWIARFRAAGAHPTFQAVQDRLAAEGDHMQGALRAARALGVVTERSVALCYDTAVQQGPGTAVKIARRVLERWAGRTVTVSELLAEYARQAAAGFRRTAAPEKAPSSPHLTWKKVAAEWHLFAGEIDLYQDVLRRRTAIVADAGLSDVPLEPDAATAVGV